MMRALYSHVNGAWAKKRRKSGRTAYEPEGDHVVFLEGVFVDRAAQGLKPRFLQGEPRTDADVARVVHTISRRLIRSTARGAVERERLEHDANGDLLSTFTRPWSDGTTGITRSPLEPMEKLAALVPLPRVHLVRCGGCLAPHSTLRAAITPTPRQQGVEESEANSPPTALGLGTVAQAGLCH